jgi:mannitol/fructose-specific phosphotransferase system IIA component (Ntr-type)
MITIADTLAPEHVILDLAGTTPSAVIAKLTAVLRNDERVLDWKAFEKEMGAQPAFRVAEGADFGICVPHARTDTVSEMVMSAGRLAQPLVFKDCPQPIRYIFCLGVPKAVAAEYLRIAGVLMRIFTDPETERALREAATREAFVATLAGLEVRF